MILKKWFKHVTTHGLQKEKFFMVSTHLKKVLPLEKEVFV